MLEEFFGLDKRVTEEFDFAYDSLGVDEVVKGVEDFLDCDLLVSLPVEGGCDDAICAGSDLFEDLVFLVDDEGRSSDFVEHSAFRDDGFLLLGFHVSYNFANIFISKF
jgi:hypothetical protein